MKIAVPTNDGASISAHFGKSSAFLVFDVQSGQIAGSTLRPNNGCHPHQSHDHACDGHGRSSHADHHTGIVSTLAGCDLVICSGIGQRAVDALAVAGIKPVFVSETGPASTIVEAYVKGLLQPNSSASCECRH